jgi:hypothetical protein
MLVFDDQLERIRRENTILLLRRKTWRSLHCNFQCGREMVNTILFFLACPWLQGCFTCLLGWTTVYVLYHCQWWITHESSELLEDRQEILTRAWLHFIYHTNQFDSALSLSELSYHAFKNGVSKKQKSSSNSGKKEELTGGALTISQRPECQWLV